MRRAAGMGFRTAAALARLSSTERRRLARIDGVLVASSLAALAAACAAAASMVGWFVEAGLPGELAASLAVSLAALSLIAAIAGRIVLLAAREWMALWRLEQDLMEGIR